MTRTIAVLEDNVDRRDVMQAILTTQWSSYSCVFFADVAPFLAWLEEHFSSVVLASLDHDLDLIPTSDGRLRDPGDGRIVARYFAEQRARFPVIIHSTNRVAVAEMSATLQEAGVPTAIVSPYEDLLWIEESWRPTLHRMMSSFAENNEPRSP